MTYLTISQFAKIKGVTKQAVHKQCKAGKYVGAYQDESGRWRIPEEALTQSKQTRRKPDGEVRKQRPLKATDGEWEQIKANAIKKNTSTNNYIVESAKGKK